MNKPQSGGNRQSLLDKLLGYFNFSAGAADTQFLAALNQLFGELYREHLASDGKLPAVTWQQIADLLGQRLQTLQKESAAFSDSVQAEAVVGSLVAATLAAYKEFHSDLLFHLEPATYQNPLFLGRVCEAVLQQGGPWNEISRITAGAVNTLNDYVGYRPVPTLESASSDEKIEPFPHEWVRPAPLYIRGAGIAQGPYYAVVETALDILRGPDQDIHHSAQFDLELMDELAIDVRAYDFDHPVNKRPNYHFGQWDPHAIDNSGRYRRFIVQQVTLDALMNRVEHPEGLPEDEVLFEAGAVLAGTILMASGISGSGPGVHDSTQSLADLLPGIASYRDSFYERLFSRTSGAHSKRLRTEMEAKRQPFGGARQHLNQQLARQRAAQLEHIQLAKIFARMGHPEAAREQADVVPAASARTMCEIDCRLSSGNRYIEQGKLEKAAAALPGVIELLKRAIQCGAMIDPRNILGFDANFSLFPAIENSVRDHRADELVVLMEQIFAFYSRVWSEAAALDNLALCEQVKAGFKKTALWWRQYAAHEVASVEAVDPLDAFNAAEHVADALNLWHKGGAATGDMAFWAKHAQMFSSPHACALVVDALMQRGDFVASRALLIHWLAQASDIPLEHGDSSFHRLVETWLLEMQRVALDTQTPAEEAVTAWSRIRKMLDYIEANAGDYWRAPVFDLAGAGNSPQSDDDVFAGGEDADEEDSLFGAAYEDMVYRDSTDDGVESEIADEGGSGADIGLEAESRRIVSRLAFLSNLANLWRLAAAAPVALIRRGAADEEANKQNANTLMSWAEHASENQQQLMGLLESVQSHRVPMPSGGHESLIEYDRHRSLKESLLERIIAAVVEIGDARRLLLAACCSVTGQADSVLENFQGIDVDQRCAIKVFASLLRGDAPAVSQRWAAMAEAFGSQPLLYVPLSKGGDPHDIVAARVRQQTVQDLLVWLPRLGLILESCRLIELARQMERDNPVGAGAVTEFDELFKIGYKAIVKSLVHSAASWEDDPPPASTSGKQPGTGKASTDKASTDKASTGKTGQASQSSANLPSGKTAGPKAGPETKGAAAGKQKNPPDDQPKDAGKDPGKDAGRDAASGKADKPERRRRATSISPGNRLVSCLEQVTESLLVNWLAHSRTLRLSVLERVKDDRSWLRLETFIKNYGADLFTQRFFNFGNIRAILHQGVDAWIDQVEEFPCEEQSFRFFQEIGEEISRGEAIELMTLVLEAIVENYGEYRDYNSTTTQSDRGELLYMLLDFLRLRMKYDRVSWNLKPVVWAHEILVRRGAGKAAQLWRRSLAERIGAEADRYQTSLATLQQKYAMRMPTIADRICERFVRPMAIDRIRALVKPAMEEARQGGPFPTFELLQHETEVLTREPTGVGLDIPAWLLALEDEVDAATRPEAESDAALAADAMIPQTTLSYFDIETQINQWKDERGPR